MALKGSEFVEARATSLLYIPISEYVKRRMPPRGFVSVFHTGFPDGVRARSMARRHMRAHGEERLPALVLIAQREGMVSPMPDGGRALASQAPKLSGA